MRTKATDAIVLQNLPLLVSDALTNIEASINSKLMEENQYVQHKKYLVFEILQHYRQQKSVALFAHYLAI